MTSGAFAKTLGTILKPRRSARRLLGVAGFCLLTGCMFVALGHWQVKPAMAQDETQAAAEDQGGGATVLTADQLKVLVAPIAFYPDDVLAVVLPASTTGLQIVQAQRFLDKHKTNPSQKPDPNWDPSVIAIINYPDVVERMNADLDWTQRLGDAVLNQQGDVMDAVQQIRNEAVTSGYLKSDTHTVIEHTQETVVIKSADPEVVYLPNYDPQVVVQQTYVSAPPPVYYPPYPSYYSPAAPFFTGMFVGAAISYGLNWGNDDIDVDFHGGDINNSFNRNNISNNGNRNTWNGNRNRASQLPSKRAGQGLAPSNRPANRNGRGNGQGIGNNGVGNNGVGNNNARSGKNQLNNRPGNKAATGRSPGGLGQGQSSGQTKQQKQRGQQSLQNRSKGSGVQNRSPQNSGGGNRAFQNGRSGNQGGAFSGAGNSGSRVGAQQRRGGASQMQRRGGGGGGGGGRRR